MDPEAHWEKVYQTKQPNQVSWYRPHGCVASPDRVGRRESRSVHHRCRGGEWTLVDDLLARGYREISILDGSSTALHVTKERLGANADKVNWLCGDVTTFGLVRHR